MMIHGVFFGSIRPDTARGNDAEGTPRAGDKSNPLRTPFRNGYVLQALRQIVTT